MSARKKQTPNSPILRMRGFPIYSLLLLTCWACHQQVKPPAVQNPGAPAVKPVPIPAPDSAGHYKRIETGKTTPAQLITFARTLTGVPYLAGSTNPTRGFDCSGFITYVFNHFGIAVPRSSVDFTHVNREVALIEAQAGDLILFTGTDSTIRVAGHMGIVVSPRGAPVMFIHSTSGKAWGVTETSLNPHYTGRFLKVVRVF